MSCPTGKRRYTNPDTATIALVEARAANALRRTRRAGRECRIYPCPVCRGWHLTSQPPRYVIGVPDRAP